MTINPVHLREKVAISKDFTTQERDLILEALNLGCFSDQHSYPSLFKPGPKQDAFVNCAWALLDQFNPSTFQLSTRYLLAGMIAGALSEMYHLGKTGKPAQAYADKFN